MDRDGTQDGYDLELLRELVARVPVPVIASGGAGAPEHLAEALEAGAEGALAASIFHDSTFSVEEVKAACRARGLPMR
jgi:cyclase